MKKSVVLLTFFLIASVANAQTVPASLNLSVKVVVLPLPPSDLAAATISYSQIDLSWTDNSSNEDGFSIEEAQGTDAIFTPIDSVGADATAYSRTGLLSNTTYFYRVRAFNDAGQTAYTNEASSTTGLPPAPPPSGGGGGGGYVIPVANSVVTFSGYAFPATQVTLLKDAQVVANTVASDDASFQMSLSGLSAGNYVFSLYGTDAYGGRSALRTFPLSVTGGASTNVSGIFLAPTITTDKSTVKQGDPVTFFGQTVPNGTVTIAVNSNGAIYATTTAGADGKYLQEIDSDPLELGQHSAYARTAARNLVTDSSNVIGFTVGTANVKRQATALKGDVNGDGRVNIVDFSVAAYWFSRKNPPANVDLNSDGMVSLTDFSIMAYNWSG